MIMDIIIPCSTAGLELVDNVIVWSQTGEYVFNHPSGINLGATPRGLRYPRGVPSVDPSTMGVKILYNLATLV